MKKIWLSLCLTLCLAGCSKPSEVVVDNTDAINEIQTNIQAINSLLSQEGALEDIRDMIAVGEVENSPITFYYEDLLLPTPSLTSDFIPQPESVKVGYNWKDQTYTCLYTCVSDTEYAYIVAKFNKDLVCDTFYASAILTRPYIDTSDSETSDSDISGENEGGYIPFPIIPDDF